MHCGGYSCVSAEDSTATLAHRQLINTFNRQKVRASIWSFSIAFFVILAPLANFLPKSLDASASFTPNTSRPAQQHALHAASLQSCPRLRPWQTSSMHGGAQQGDCVNNLNMHQSKPQAQYTGCLSMHPMTDKCAVPCYATLAQRCALLQQIRASLHGNAAVQTCVEPVIKAACGWCACVHTAQALHACSGQGRVRVTGIGLPQAAHPGWW